MATCPNCGGEVVGQLTLQVEQDDGTTVEGETVEPEGNVGVCSQCQQAVDLSQPEEEKVEAPLPEASPRGEPGPVRLEDRTDVEATEAAETLAAEEGVNLSAVEGTGEGGRILVEDVEREVESDV